MFVRRWSFALMVLSILVSGRSIHAQSGSRFQPSIQSGSGSRVPQGSGLRAGSGSRRANARIGLQGYCPVCVVEMKKWVKGAAQHQYAYDGVTYLFPGPEQLAMFRADPAKYAPALGGDCTVCLVKSGKRTPGSVYFSATSGGRLFLFPSENERREFLADPAKYADADLAMDGKCAVCRVEMGQDVPGRAEFAAYHQGMRYLFPAAKQRDMFLADPAKYAVRSASPRGGAFPTSAPSARGDEQVVTVVGRSGCAGCEHGVSPLGHPDELGLAVIADNGDVFVIEGAHLSHPKIYDDRFQNLKLSVRGTVVQHKGRVRWLEPAELRVVEG